MWLQTAFSPMRCSNEVHALDTLYNSAYYTFTQSASFVCLYGFVVDAMYYSCDKWVWLKSLLSMVRHSQTLRQQFQRPAPIPLEHAVLTENLFYP